MMHFVAMLNRIIRNFKKKDLTMRKRGVICSKKCENVMRWKFHRVNGALYLFSGILFYIFFTMVLFLNND